MTPKIVQKLIFITSAIALLAALTEPLFNKVLGVPGLQFWLSSSLQGIKHYFFWQPFTYLFLQSGGIKGITLSFLIGLAFNMGILWYVGSEIVKTIGSRSFLLLYFLSGIIAALFAIFVMYLTENEILAGPFPSILTLFTLWALLNPENELLLFFVFPLKIKWLLAALFGGLLLINLSQLNWVYLTLYMSSLAIGYFYAVAVLGFSSPFSVTQPVDRFIHRLTRTKENQFKIFDFKTGQPLLNDDQFVDAMLTKISRYGEGSLTRGEKKRMDEISERKRKLK